jgi:hypothetical protein
LDLVELEDVAVGGGVAEVLLQEVVHLQLLGDEGQLGEVDLFQTDQPFDGQLYCQFEAVGTAEYRFLIDEHKVDVGIFGTYLGLLYFEGVL